MVQPAPLQKPGSSGSNQLSQPKPVPPSDASIFGGKDWLKFDEATKKMIKTPSSYVPGYGNITKSEINKIAANLKQKYGEYLKSQDKYRIIKDYEIEISKTQGPAKYQKMKEYNFLKKQLFGK